MLYTLRYAIYARSLQELVRVRQITRYSYKLSGLLSIGVNYSFALFTRRAVNWLRTQRGKHQQPPFPLQRTDGAAARFCACLSIHGRSQHATQPSCGQFPKRIRNSCSAAVYTYFALFLKGSMNLTDIFQHILPTASLLLFALSTLDAQETMDDTAQVVKRHLEELPDIKDASFSEHFDRFGDAKVSKQPRVFVT